MPSPKVNPASLEPSYYQLANIIQRQISSGELRPGDRLPTEKQLCEYHSISPMTVHRAITLLAKDGVVTTQRGKGIFVKPMRFWEATFKLGKLQDIFSEDSDASVKILGLMIIPADARVADKMAIEAGKKVIYIRRLISLNEKPFLYHKEYLLYDPHSPIIESEMEVTSLKGLFDERGNGYFRNSALSIHSVNLQAEEARVMGAPVNTAAFRIEHSFYDYDNRPVSWGWFICPGELIHFSAVSGIGNEE